MKPKQKLLSKKEFADLAGVCPSAITKQLKGKLQKALKGNKIDTGHPYAIAYLTHKRNPINYDHDKEQALDEVILRSMVVAVFRSFEQILKTYCENGDKSVAVAICNVINKPEHLSIVSSFLEKSRRAFVAEAVEILKNELGDE